MVKYSQNLEEQHILNYFGNFKGSLLDIGANDGKTFSNSLKLIELGWEATLVEPSPKAFNKLSELHFGNKNVTCINTAIGTKNGTMILHESSHHNKDQKDIALLSSLKESETERWKKSGVKFNQCEVNVSTYKKVFETSVFDFITIDAEGYDLEILRQIDLTDTKLLCIEWNTNDQAKGQILEYTIKFGMNKIIYVSGENLLIGR
jgi:FkbM family methyltransferase